MTEAREERSSSWYSVLSTDLTAHMFEHLDADEHVEGVLPVGGNVAVVHEVHTDASDEALFSDPLLRKCLLLDGERECVDLAAYDAATCVRELLVRSGGRNAVGTDADMEARDAPLSRALPIRRQTRGVGRQV